MDNKSVVIALVLAATAIICTGLVIYFSPFHTCVRAEEPAGAGYGDLSVVLVCASAAAGGGGPF